MKQSGRIRLNNASRGYQTKEVDNTNYNQADLSRTNRGGIEKIIVNKARGHGHNEQRV